MGRDFGALLYQPHPKHGHGCRHPKPCLWGRGPEHPEPGGDPGVAGGGPNSSPCPLASQWDEKVEEEEEGRRGGRAPWRCGEGAASLGAHTATASSFLFLFSVLLAKQHNVYTSGYYICQNNYSMTNGTSM